MVDIVHRIGIHASATKVGASSMDRRNGSGRCAAWPGVGYLSDSCASRPQSGRPGRYSGFKHVRGSLVVRDSHARREIELTASVGVTLLTLAVGAGRAQVLPACHVRGSQRWLATRPSPLDSVAVTVRGATAKVCYSRPSTRGRSVDSLVPPGIAWRMGANEPTTITLSDTMMIGGARLPTGRYVMLGVPGVSRWTIAFYATADTEPAKMFQNMKQLATGTGTVERVADPLEQFTIRGAGDSSKAELLLEWGTWRVHISVEPAS